MRAYVRVQAVSSTGLRRLLYLLLSVKHPTVSLVVCCNATVVVFFRGRLSQCGHNIFKVRVEGLAISTKLLHLDRQIVTRKAAILTGGRSATRSEADRRPCVVPNHCKSEVRNLAATSTKQDIARKNLSGWAMFDSSWHLSANGAELRASDLPNSSGTGRSEAACEETGPDSDSTAR